MRSLLQWTDQNETWHFWEHQAKSLPIFVREGGAYHYASGIGCLNHTNGFRLSRFHPWIDNDNMWLSTVVAKSFSDNKHILYMTMKTTHRSSVIQWVLVHRYCIHLAISATLRHTTWIYFIYTHLQIKFLAFYITMYYLQSTAMIYQCMLYIQKIKPILIRLKPILQTKYKWQSYGFEHTKHGLWAVKINKWPLQMQTRWFKHGWVSLNLEIIHEDVSDVSFEQ